MDSLWQSIITVLGSFGSSIGGAYFTAKWQTEKSLKEAQARHQLAMRSHKEKVVHETLRERQEHIRKVLSDFNGEYISFFGSIDANNSRERESHSKLEKAWNEMQKEYEIIQMNLPTKVHSAFTQMNSDSTAILAASQLMQGPAHNSLESLAPEMKVFLTIEGVNKYYAHHTELLEEIRKFTVGED